LITVLLGGNSEEIACLNVIGVKSHRPLEGNPGIRCDDAIRSKDKRLAQCRLAVRCFAVEPQRVGSCLHGIIETTQPHVDWRDHFPAAAIVRPLFEMCLHLRNKVVDRLTAGGLSQSGRKRPIR